MNCRDLTEMTQVARGEFLEAKQDEAFSALLSAEGSARAVESAPTLAQVMARRKLEYAIAFCEEWDALGKAC